MHNSFSLKGESLILDLVKSSPEGWSIDEIQQQLYLKIPRRTLQRRLAALLLDKKVIKTGRGKSTRYHSVVVQRKINEDTYLSTDSLEIKNYLQQALSVRVSTQYNRTFLDAYHPNITYYLSDTVRAHLHAMGEPFSNSRPAGTYAKEILSRFLLDLSWNSSRLEGNTYSLLETERLFKFGEIAEGKNNFEAQMILNHKSAIEFLVETANEINFNRFTMLNLHALLSDNLLGNPEACGQLRKISVGIRGTVYQPLVIPQMVEECFAEILFKASAIHDPFEQSFFIMVQLPYLQPFEDVNKRVSRLAANIPLIKHNLCPLSFVDVNDRDYIDSMLGIYELNRIELLRDLFVWAYERSARRYLSVQHSLGEPDPFRLRYRSQLMDIISQVVKQGMNKKLATVYIQQWVAQQIIAKDRGRFIEVAETELLALHAGNIARYHLRISEFELWLQQFLN